MEYQRKNRDFADIAVSVGRFLWAAAEEIASGILNNRVPAKTCYAGLLLALVFYFRLDSWILGSLGLKFRLGGSLRLFLTYASLISGWVLWGVARAGARNRLLNRLKDAFSAANLKCNGRLPSLIEDLRVDDYVRKLRLLCHGIPKADFEKEIKRIESVLNVTVVKLHQDENDKSKIEINSDWSFARRYDPHQHARCRSHSCRRTNRRRKVELSKGCDDGFDVE